MIYSEGRSLTKDALMYCTLENQAYRFVYRSAEPVVKLVNLSTEHEKFLSQHLMKVNDTDYINLFYAIKLDLSMNNTVEMRDGKQIGISVEKSDSLLNWFLLI